MGIVRILCDVIELEKGIKSPTLHPDDIAVYLFWGTGDDLSPLFFREGFRETFGIHLTEAQMNQFWEEEWTVRQIVEKCDQLISAEARS